MSLKDWSKRRKETVPEVASKIPEEGEGSGTVGGGGEMKMESGDVEMSSNEVVVGTSSQLSR